jgi:hypothetical protein
VHLMLFSTVGGAFGWSTNHTWKNINVFIFHCIKW